MSVVSIPSSRNTSASCSWCMKAWT